MIIIPQIVETVVSRLRKTGKILTISCVSGSKYRITTDVNISLKGGDYITISGTTQFNNENVKVISVESRNVFTVDNGISSLTDETSGLWVANAPYFVFGSYAELMEWLKNRNDSKTFKNQRFPLVALIDYGTESISNQENIYEETNLYMILLTPTDVNWTNTRRLQESFIKTLYPLYYELIYEFKRNKDKFFHIMPSDKPLHEKTDCFFVGSEKSQNIINEFVDAIEIKNLKIKILNN